jgi:hypothetical protein
LTKRKLRYVLSKLLLQNFLGRFRTPDTAQLNRLSKKGVDTKTASYRAGGICTAIIF